MTTPITTPLSSASTEDIQKITNLGVSESIAKVIVDECSKSPDAKHCTIAVLGVANAESSLFKRCSNNNCHGVMQRDKNGARSLKRFDSIEDGVKDWIHRYIRNQRYVRDTAKRWINAGYCNVKEGDGCRNRTNHYSSIESKM